MRRAWILFALVMAAGQVAAKPPAKNEAAKAEPVLDLEKMCAEVQCRHDVRIVLKEEDGSTYDKTFEALPVITPNGVAVYAGQTVLFEADIEDGRLVNIRLVDAIADPAKTVSSRLEQDEDGGMLLVTKNPFGKSLRIRMGMMPMGHDGLLKTSSCPVIPGGSSYEMWPDPIFQIYLGDMRLLEADETMACVE